MNYEIVVMPAMTVMGAELRTTWMNKECHAAIPAFWQKQRSERLLARIQGKVYPDVMLAVYTNYTDDFSLTSGYYSMIIGCPVISGAVVPEGMVVHEIPTAKYAVFTAQGPFALGVVKAWMDIWQTNDFKRTFTNDFEWYDSKSTNDVNSIVKVYVSIQ